MALQNHACVKDLFKVEDRPMAFNVTEWEKFIDIVSDFTWQLIFKKLLLVGIWCCVIGYPQLTKKSIKIPLRFM